MTIIDRSAGRSTFGTDPATYDWARPQYPDAIYDALRDVCGLGTRSRVFEIGPGTGIATRKLLSLGANVTAIEPDTRLGDYLERSLPPAPGNLQVVLAAFEDADLGEGSYDLGVSATAFHWLEQSSALAKVHRLLRPGGWWAVWWATHYDPAARDAFDRATQHLFTELSESPSHSGGGKLPFVLDAAARLADLHTAGFSEIKHIDLRNKLMFDTARLVALFSTFSPILHLPEDRRAHFLAELRRITDQEFGGQVERPLITSLYLGRR